MKRKKKTVKQASPLRSTLSWGTLDYLLEHFRTHGKTPLAPDRLYSDEWKQLTAKPRKRRKKSK